MMRYSLFQFPNSLRKGSEFVSFRTAALPLSDGKITVLPAVIGSSLGRN